METEIVMLAWLNTFSVEKQTLVINLTSAIVYVHLWNNLSLSLSLSLSLHI